MGRIINATNAIAAGTFPTSMRAAPTITAGDNFATGLYHVPGLAAYTPSSIPYHSSSTTGFHININKSSGSSSGDIGHVVGDKF